MRPKKKKKPNKQANKKTNKQKKKPEALCHCRCGTIKISPCSKALSAEHGLNFAALHRYKW
jgi:hypothetical protein